MEEPGKEMSKSKVKVGKKGSRPEYRHWEAENGDWKLGSWMFKQVKQAREGELSWLLGTEGQKWSESGRQSKKYKDEEDISKWI